MAQSAASAAIQDGKAKAIQQRQQGLQGVGGQEHDRQGQPNGMGMVMRLRLPDHDMEVGQGGGGYWCGCFHAADYAPLHRHGQRKVSDP
jgi:hypothetical protein